MQPLPFPKISPEVTCVLNYGPEGWNWHSRARSYVNLWVALRGKGIMEINGQAHPIAPATAFFLRPYDSVHAWHEAGNPVSNFSLHFVPLKSSGRRWEDYDVLLGQPLRPLQTWPRIVNQWQLVRELWEMGDELAQQQLPIASLQLLQMVWRDLQESPEGPLEALIRVQASRMREAPAQGWPVEQLAREAGCSRAHYTRRFTRVMKLPPNAYLIQTRMETAASLLRDSTLSIKQIADGLGYTDAFFFCRQFKSRMGISPRMYRLQR